MVEKSALLGGQRVLFVFRKGLKEELSDHGMNRASNSGVFVLQQQEQVLVDQCRIGTQCSLKRDFREGELLQDLQEGLPQHIVSGL